MDTDTTADTPAKPVPVTVETPKTQIEKLDARIKALTLRRALVVSRETTEQRKLRNRKCAILGGWLLANDQARVAEIVASLARAQDRVVFGLEPLPVPVAAVRVSNTEMHPTEDKNFCGGCPVCAGSVGVIHNGNDCGVMWYDKADNNIARCDKCGYAEDRNGNEIE